MVFQKAHAFTSLILPHINAKECKIHCALLLLLLYNVNAKLKGIALNT